MATSTLAVSDALGRTNREIVRPSASYTEHLPILCMPERAATLVGMTRAAVVLALATMGCGGFGPDESSDPTVPLQGSWVVVSANNVVGIGLTISGDRYVSSVARESAAGIDAQVERGTYAVTGSNLTFTPMDWSCPGPDRAYATGYSVTGDRLALTSPNGAVSMVRNVDGGGGVAIQYGCFATDGTFTPMPLAPVQ